MSTEERLNKFSEIAVQVVSRIAEMYKEPAYQEEMAAREESLKPTPTNRCKTKRCNGEVTKRVLGANSGGYFYSPPSCTICERVYLLATNVRATGMDEFKKALHTVY